VGDKKDRGLGPESKITDEKGGSKIGRCGSRDHWIGRCRGRNWNSVWGLYYW
jgi:hypothetical protein